MPLEEGATGYVVDPGDAETSRLPTIRTMFAGAPIVVTVKRQGEEHWENMELCKTPILIYQGNWQQIAAQPIHGSQGLEFPAGWEPLGAVNNFDWHMALVAISRFCGLGFVRSRVDAPEGWRKEVRLELSMAPRASRTAALACGVHLPFVTTTTTAAARAPPSMVGIATGAEQAGAKASSPYEPSARAARSSTCAASRTPFVRHYDNNGDRQRRGRRRQLALEERGGSSPRTRGYDGSSSARLLTKAASAPAVCHDDDGSRACVTDDDGSCSCDAAT